jgi:iron-sulfur cluster repair protein YtfE (RIC family)
MRFTQISERSSRDTAVVQSPVEMLLGCHARIRHFMQLSRTLAEAEGVSLKEIADTAHAIVRYFSHALPLHEADENDTLFPHLQAVLPPGSLVREAAETMVEQHKAIDELAAELLSLCASVGRHPECLPSVARRLDQVARALDQIFAAHLHMEETVIFPAMAELLNSEQIAEMSQEMQQRRRRPLDTLHLVI